MRIKMKPWSLIPSCVYRSQVLRKHTMTSLFRPTYVNPNQKPHEVVDGCKSQRLMVDNGLIRASSAGSSYHLLPVAVKSLEKLIKIIDTVLDEYSCQKIQMPTLTPAHFWTMTGRLDQVGTEIMMLNDRHHKKLILSPTHEEAICDLLREYPWNYKNLPLRLYQVTSKFRDELRPRYGLLRAREFLMKDLYTFDADEEGSLKTYEEINEAYAKIFDKVGVKYMKVQGSSGVMGGDISHEYHLISDIGEDKLISCVDCGASMNKELINEGNYTVETEEEDTPVSCSKCDSRNVTEHGGIEVGHTFVLGKKYSNVFKTTFLNKGKPAVMDMGCYGIGVTRLLAGVIEVLSTNEEMRWPSCIAPYTFALLPPKKGSKEEAHGGDLTENLFSFLNEIFPNETLLDDRIDMTIGKRQKDVKILGVPHIIILGKTIMDTVPLIEVQNLTTDTTNNLTFSQLQDYVTQLKNNRTMR